MNQLKFFTIILILITSSLSAQQDRVGNWLMYFGANKISNQLSIHTEVQYRNHTLAPVNTEQLLIRIGLNYHFTSNAFATAGYGYIAGHQYESVQSGPESVEHRVWQQFILTNKIGRVKLEHRYRLEQRWVNDVYKNRFRYRLMLFIPLNNKTIEKGTLFLGVYDEVFINDRSTFFDRNRLYGALGYQINKSTSVQLGMMRQVLSSSGKNYIQFVLSIKNIRD